MTHTSQLLVIVLALAYATGARASGLYSQLVLTLGTERPFHHAYHQSENALVLELEKTAPSELAALEHYDERLVKRVLVKDLGPAGTEVKLVLRDRKVRASVYKLAEPFRIAIDLFDADYRETRDPTTGMPLAAGKSTAAAAGAGGSYELVQPVDHPAPMPAHHDAPPAATSQGSPRRLLVSPIEDLSDDPLALTAKMKETADGPGKAWATFPPYVYRLSSAPYEAGLAREPKALGPAAALADQGGQLFNAGHDARALLAYTQVLHKDPTLFDKDALHLWKLAEANLGHGNLTLARGYYQAMLEKHPESPLTRFAELRILDIAAIRLAAQGKEAEQRELLERLRRINARGNGELAALVAIRQAYWSAGATPESALPPIDGATRQALAASAAHTETRKTGFLTASLLLSDMLRADTPWDRSYGPFAAEYFKSYKGPAGEPHSSRLQDALQKKLSATLQGKVSDGKLFEALDDYKALPPSLASIAKDARNAWVLAEAHRKLGQLREAVPHYETAAKGVPDGPDRFKAQFWLAVTAGAVAEELKARKAEPRAVETLTKKSQDADRAAGAQWQKLTDDERKQLEVAMKEPFEKAVTDPARLRTPARIVLATWTTRLSSRAAATAGSEPTDWERNFSPTGSAVVLLTDLQKRFGEMGMTAERRQAASLLRHVKPSDMADDKAAKDAWARELLALAEEHRRANEYLEAGRLFGLVGKEAENFEGRAEALYKGGLLLFRAGRREEALEAFKQASEDGNNLFYANLAKERLSQIE